jgi:hypothetical protein
MAPQYHRQKSEKSEFEIGARLNPLSSRGYYVARRGFLLQRGGAKVLVDHIRKFNY